MAVEGADRLLESTVLLIGCAGGGRRAFLVRERNKLGQLTAAAEAQMQQLDSAGAASQVREHRKGE